MTAPRAKRPPSPRSAESAPRAATRAAAAPEWPSERTLDVLTLIVIGVAAIVLITIALGPHRVGDYFTESDFYGSYVVGAHGLRAGHVEPSRERW